MLRSTRTLKSLKSAWELLKVWVIQEEIPEMIKTPIRKVLATSPTTSLIDRNLGPIYPIANVDQLNTLSLFKVRTKEEGQVQATNMLKNQGR